MNKLTSKITSRNDRNSELASVPALSMAQRQRLETLTKEYGLSLAAGDLDLLDGRWYVTHSGLLRLARRNRCSGIQTEIVAELSSMDANRWIVRATVFKTPRSRGFVGYGDADPSNIAPMLNGAELRIAETRAVNRALRKAYGIGTCSIEELGANVRPAGGRQIEEPTVNRNRQPCLRYRLLSLIRKYRLNAEQVKHYAAQFCGTAALREASREQVQKLVDHLEALAAEGRDRLIAELASAGEMPCKAGPTQQGEAEQIKEAA